jgi:hypothetical protein
MPRKSVMDQYYDNEVKGWDSALEKVEQPAFLAASQMPLFESAAWYLMDMPDKETFLYRFFVQKFGKWWPNYQRRGTCVGQGYAKAATVLMCINEVLGLGKCPGHAAVSSIYAGSRVDVANRPGKWDGSTGVWANKWLTNWGVMVQSEQGLADTDYTKDEVNAINWTRSPKGVPTDKEKLAKVRPVTETPLISSARAVGKAIENGIPVANCCNLIPTGKRNAKGFSSLRSGGGHCTCFLAVRYNPFGLLYVNSWGPQWGTGGKYPDDMPEGSVWLDEDACNAIVKQRATYALVGLNGLTPLSEQVLL